MNLIIDHNSVLYRIISYCGQLFIKVIEFILTLFAKEKKALIDPHTLPWTKNLEDNAETILQELNTILIDYASIPTIGDLSEEQNRIIKGEHNWKTFTLYAYGARVEKNIRKCPQTDKVVSAIPGMTMAFFSILEPHTSLIPHRGPYKGILRYHLGLIIPEPAELCGIKIDGQTYHWQKGKSLVFDDTYTHEVWNNSDEKRVVLFIDFKRDYIFPINLLNNLIIALIRMSPFISNAVARLEK